MPPSSPAPSTLILGVGNLLLGDEGVGVHVVRRLEQMPLPVGIECLDGGTGSFQLLDPMLAAEKLVLIDATADGRPAGTLRRLQPRFARDYPPSLSAHDIGLKDLLDTFHLLRGPAQVVLFAVSIESFQELGMELSAAVAERLEEIAAVVWEEVALPWARARAGTDEARPSA